MRAAAEVTPPATTIAARNLGLAFTPVILPYVDSERLLHVAPSRSCRGYRRQMGKQDDPNAAAVRENMAQAAVGIGRRLRAARKDAGLTMERIAAELGLAKATVGHWETGRNHLAAAELAYLAKRYGQDAGYLLTGERASVLTLEAERIARQFMDLPDESRKFIAETIEDRLRRDKVGTGRPGKPSRKAG